MEAQRPKTDETVYVFEKGSFQKDFIKENCTNTRTKITLESFLKTEPPPAKAETYKNVQNYSNMELNDSTTLNSMDQAGKKDS